MSLVTSETKLSDIILNNDPSLLTVINRFGITLGTGEKTISTVCREMNLNPQFVGAIINTYINEEYFPEKMLSSFSPVTIIEYLGKTNAYYEHFLIPNCERHFQLLLSRTSGNNNISLMMKFFDEVKQEILARTENDRMVLFPAIMNGKSANCDGRQGITEKALRLDANIEDKISDLINMFVVHFSGDYDRNLGVAVFTAISNLKRDIKQDNRIMNRILLPLYHNLSKEQR